MKQDALRTAFHAFLALGLTRTLDCVTGLTVSDLHVSIGMAARSALCDAFASAGRSIDAQFYSLRDPDVLKSLNAAAQRGVDVTVRLEGDVGRYDHARAHTPTDEHVRATYSRYAKLFDAHVHVIAEADPLELDHAKAAVIDDARAFVETANPNPEGFAAPGEVLVEDDEPRDVAAIRSGIEHLPAQTVRVISGPDSSCRSRIETLLATPVDERIAVERLSDPRIVDELTERHARGLRDRVLVNTKGERPNEWLQQLIASGVDVRTTANQYMHDKYVDAGDRIYVGSGNLTRNGLDEAREIGIIASPGDFDDGAIALRADFDRMWSSALTLTA